MGQSTEDIEAKLAAFVDGELDAAGREEIERHLQANPQHRVLLSDLMRGRELLRDLPHETAPAEILESIQGHLERRLLLDEESASVATRAHSPLRSYMAVAAVLLLTGTLGLVIYSVLPNAKQGTDLAVALDRAESAPAERLPFSPESRVGGDAVVSPGQPETAAAVHDRALVAASDAILSPAAAVASAEGAARIAEPELARPTATVPPLADAAPAGLDQPFAPVIVLASDDPAATERELSAVLFDNRVTFEQLPMKAGGMRRAADAERLDATNGLAQAKEGAAGESIFVAKRITRAQYQAIDQALRSPSRARKQEVAPDTQQQYQSYRQGSARAEDDAAKALDGFRPNQPGEMARSAQNEAVGGEPATQPGRPGMGVEATPREAMGKDVIAVGDKLKVDLPQMVQSNIAGSQIVEVAPDGTIQVPPLEPVPAVGLTTAELREKFAAQLGEGKAGPVGEISINRDESAEPLTDVVIVVRAVGGPSVGESDPSTGASTDPATQPADAATRVPSPASEIPATGPSAGHTNEPPPVSPATQPRN